MAAELIESKVERSQYGRMVGDDVHGASLVAARQVPFSGLQGNDPIPWLHSNFAIWNIA